MKKFIDVVIFATWVVATVSAAGPSPADWRDENIYQIITDRFFDGDPSNNYAETNRGVAYAPTNSKGIHGGDFKGIQQKLDYIKALGATAIWISPIPLNVSGSAYHGYGAQDFYTLAPHWGSLIDLSNMVAAAHARGIHVVFDVVVNHSGDLIYSTGSGYPNFKTPPAGYVMKYRNSANQQASPFNITNTTPQAFTSIFHTNGVIQNFSINTQVEKGELSNLDDFNTELTYVRTNMANIYRYWIQTGDLDGFRIDTVKHVDHGNGGFWNYWCPQIHNFGTSIGKSNFFMFGEVYDGSDQKNGYYTGTMLSTNFALDATVDYPLYFMVNSVFATQTGNTSQIEDHYNAIPTYYDPAAWYRLVTFLDNHDQPRFLSSGNANNNTNRLAVAVAFLYTSRGIPCLYYGTEQAFNGGSDPNNREDMFDGQWEQGPSLGDNFNETHPLFRYVAMLNNFRRLYPSLRTGGHRNLWNNSTGPGLFAYARTNATEEVVVVFNTASSSQTLPARATTYSAGTVLVNLLNTNETITVDSTPNIPSITVPSTVAKIFVAQSLMKPLDPVVLSQSPAHAATGVSPGAQIVLQFSKPMDTNSVKAAFSPTNGVFSWSGTTQMTFTASGGFPLATTNSVRLATNAVDAVSGNSLFAPFETFFVTATNAIFDLTPPTVSITAPASNSTLTGSITLTGTAADNIAVAKVEFQLDGGDWIMVSGTASWSFTFNTQNELNGWHTISARSTDTSGNVSGTATVPVRFFNVPGSYLTRLSPGNPVAATNCDSTVWLADQAYTFNSFGYSGGATGFVGSVISNVCATADPLYQWERYSTPVGSFRYLFDCPAGIYETTLLEAETFWTNDNQRVFNVFIQGQQVLANFDIYSAAGNMNTAVSLVFTSAVADAQLEILFSSSIDNARASGIQVRKIADLDSDGDGIPDWWTLAYFNHPTGQIADQSCASCDPDGDGLTNLQEFLGGTNPGTSNSTTAVASFTGTPTSGNAPLAVTFTDTSTGPITNRFWDFGDGGTTNVGTYVTTVQHTYNTVHTNTVTLIVAGLFGNISTNTHANYIVVSPSQTPTPPSNLSATSVFEDQIALVWHDNSTNELAFVVQRAISAGGPWTPVTSVATSVTNYIDCALEGGITYFYEVLATNSFGLSLPSNIASATTPSMNGVLAFDRASNYTGGWTNGSTGGLGFGPWSLQQTIANGSSNGFFIGSSGGNGGGGGTTIDSCGASFGIYANTGCSAVASRSLTTSLGIGESLRWRLDNGWINTGDSAGIALRTTGIIAVNDYTNSATRLMFYFLGGTNNYFVSDAAGVRNTGIGWSSQALELQFTLTGLNTYALKISRLENGTVTNLTGTLAGTGTLGSFAVFNHNAGTGGNYDFFANSFIRLASTNATDSVGDGIPDAWRAQYFPAVDPTGATTNGLSCALCDPDGDGMNNLQEFLTGTDPTDPTSTFAITDISLSNNDVVVTWKTQPDKTNQLQRNFALGASGSWTNVGGVTIGTGTQTDFGAGTNPPPLFYRVRLVP